MVNYATGGLLHCLSVFLTVITYFEQHYTCSTYSLGPFIVKLSSGCNAESQTKLSQQQQSKGCFF